MSRRSTIQTNAINSVRDTGEARARGGRSRSADCRRRTERMRSSTSGAWGRLDALAQLAAFAGDGDASAHMRDGARRTRPRPTIESSGTCSPTDLYLEFGSMSASRCPIPADATFTPTRTWRRSSSGIADEAKARRILAHLDRRYDALCQEFRLSRDAIYATPANMYPVSRLGDLVDFGKHDSQAVYPHYENGCSCTNYTGLEIAARGSRARRTPPMTPLSG